MGDKGTVVTDGLALLQVVSYDYPKGLSGNEAWSEETDFWGTISGMTGPTTQIVAIYEYLKRSSRRCFLLL